MKQYTVSVQFSHSVMSDSLWSHELQHARPPCPSPTPGVYSNSCPLSQWCHPTISSSVIPFSPAFSLSQHQGLFQGIAQLVKNLPTRVGDKRDVGLILGSRRSLGGGNGNPLQYSCLKNSMDRGAWQVTVHGVTRVRHDLVTKPPKHKTFRRKHRVKFLWPHIWQWIL